MNTINASMGYSGFQLHLGCSPHLILPIVPTSLPAKLHSTASMAESAISRITMDIADAKDNLLLAKLTQASGANKSHGKEICYQIGYKAMLNTFHRWHNYQQKRDGCAAKFFPRWDGPYSIIKTHPELSSYTLDNNDTYPCYASQLKPYCNNNAILFPNGELPKPRPVLTLDGLQEHTINKILDMWKCKWGYQYLVHWVGFGPKDDEWLPQKDVEDCEALDQWIEANGDWPAAEQ